MILARPRFDGLLEACRQALLNFAKQYEEERRNKGYSPYDIWSLSGPWLLSRVLLYVAALGLCLTYTLAIKDRVAFLIGPRPATPWLLRGARVAAFVTAYVAPAVLVGLFVLNLPATLDALVP